MNAPIEITTGQMRTFTGRMINPLKIKITDVDLDDIAQSLSNQCRFTGHGRSFYSVAQHSVLVAGHVWDLTQSMELTLAALFHDASEAYLVDLSAPVKHLPEFKIFREVEEHVQHTIEARFGFEYGIFEHPVIKRADLALCWTEMRDLMGKDPEPGQEVLNLTIIPLVPKLARASWFTMLDWLTAGDRDSLLPGRDREYFGQLPSIVIG